MSRPQDVMSRNSFVSMHEAARHVIHCSEMLDTLILVIDNLKKEISSSFAQSDPAFVAITKDLSFCTSLLKSSSSIE